MKNTTSVRLSSYTVTIKIDKIMTLKNRATPRQKYVTYKKKETKKTRENHRNMKTPSKTIKSVKIQKNIPIHLFFRLSSHAI